MKIGAAIVTLLLAVGGVLAAYFVSSMLQSTRNETRHQEFLAELQRLQASLTELSSTRRGFVITGEDRLLEAFNVRKREAMTRLTELRHLAGGDARQQGRIQAIESLIVARLAALDESIALKQSDPKNYVAQAQATSAAISSVEELGNLIDEMALHEQNLIAVHGNEFESKAWGVIVVVGAVDVVALMVVLIASEVVRREMRQKQQAQDSLKAANEQLERAVIRRTEELVYANDSLRAEVAQRIEVENSLRQHALQMENLSAHVVAVQEGERARLARELHDEIGQILTAIKLNLQAISAAGSKRSEIALSESVQLVDSAVAQVRDFSLTLRPALLDDLGLVPAIRWLVDREAQRAGLNARLTVSPDELRIEPELATTCFRIVQESLTNVIRHASAHNLSVNLQQRASELWLTVVDDGVGFDVPPSAQWGANAGKGFLGMRERLTLIGGHLEVTSAPWHGTTVSVHIPLANAAESSDSLLGMIADESNSCPGG